jgi:formyltetrahydrofolate deformylase
MPAKTDVGRLIVSCPDRPGIIAAISAALARAGANIVASDQHSTDPEGGDFFLRMEFHLEGLAHRRTELEQRMGDVGAELDLQWRLTSAEEHKRVALFASRPDHCLLDLLWRWRTGELEMDVVGVVSNYPDHERDVRAFGVPYHHIPVAPETKPQAEQQELDLLAGKVDLVVLARYMQILSANFLARVGVPIINIHHSFLPAFAGAEPYASAYERGVKLIGATAHYVTEGLDEGPIIEQDVARVSHRHGPDDLTRLGRDIERMVLVRAVRWHLDDRVIVHRNRTIVFV